MRIKAGDVLELGSAEAGVRSYLAIHGEWLLPSVMGSYSTLSRVNIGGFSGRPLKEGDVLKWDARRVAINHIRHIPEHFLPQYIRERVVRIVEGPEIDWISASERKNMSRHSFAVLPQSDRMGVRLEGAAFNLKRKSMLSSATIPGTIQLPEAGKPIILMQDGQTTGGYPRIGKIIEADLGFIAQLRPGDHVKFRLVSIKEARKAWHYKQQILNALGE